MSVIERTAPNGDFYRIEALERVIGNQAPYFSVTCSVWAPRRNASGATRAARGYDIDAGGCMHDEILALAPELAPVVLVHLASADGTPMHAKANGWYFYSGKASAYERKSIARGQDWGYARALETSDHERAARALHIAPDVLPVGMDETAFHAFVDGLADTYQAQAQAARSVIASMENGGHI